MQTLIGCQPQGCANCIVIGRVCTTLSHFCSVSAEKVVQKITLLKALHNFVQCNARKVVHIIPYRGILHNRKSITLRKKPEKLCKSHCFQLSLHNFSQLTPCPCRKSCADRHFLKAFAQLPIRSASISPARCKWCREVSRPDTGLLPLPCHRVPVSLLCR